MGLPDRISGKKKGKWEQFLDGVDYIAARETIRDLIKFTAEKGEREGGSYYVKQTHLDALDPFMENPCYETALNFLKITDGTFADVFENSKHRKLFSSDL